MAFVAERASRWEEIVQRIHARPATTRAARQSVIPAHTSRIDSRRLILAIGLARLPPLRR